MKTIITRTIPIILFLFLGTATLQAQFDIVDPPCYGPADNGGEKQMQLDGYEARYQGGKNCRSDDPGEDQPMNYNINFGNLQELFNIQSALSFYSRYKQNEWLGKQEETFRREINRTLGKNHTSFRAAQKDLYRAYEVSARGFEREARELSDSYFERGASKSNQQQQYSRELYYAREWESLRSWCSQWEGPDCDAFGSYKVQGVLLRNVVNESDLKNLQRHAKEDFGDLEFGAAQDVSWGYGIRNMVDNEEFLNNIINTHVNFYNNKSLKEKVFLMTNYLLTYNFPTQAPMASPSSAYNIPTYWDQNTLFQEGKKYATNIPESALVFSDDYIGDSISDCEINNNTNCHQDVLEMIELRESVILDHLDAPLFSEAFIREQEPDYSSQLVTNPFGQNSFIHENAFTIENSIGHTIAFVTPDETFFFWNSDLEGYSREETGNSWRMSYAGYMEDKFMRKSEPISWGIYKAADDLGGFILDLVGDPNETISDYAKGIVTIITLDFDLDKTWENLVNADLTDASYIAATLALGHLAGPRGTGFVTSSETAQLQQFLERYASKVKPVRLTWPEVLDLFRRARDFELAISNYLPTIYTLGNGYKVFNQVYLKVGNTISIADNLIYNSQTGKWILNESKYGVHNTLSKNQKIIEDAIRRGEAIEIRTSETLIPGVAEQGSFIKFSEILRSHSVNGNIIFDTIETIWKE